MKKSMILTGALLLGISLSGAAMADTFAKKGKTTCYVFKNDEFSQKASCSYKANGEYAGNGGFFDAGFKLKGVKGITKVHLSGTTWHGYQYKLNGQDATEFYRHKSDLTKLSDVQTKQLNENGVGLDKVILCVKDSRGNEFCYADIHILGV